MISPIFVYKKRVALYSRKRQPKFSKIKRCKLRLYVIINFLPEIFDSFSTGLSCKLLHFGILEWQWGKRFLLWCRRLVPACDVFLPVWVHLIDWWVYSLDCRGRQDLRTHLFRSIAGFPPRTIRSIVLSLQSCLSDFAPKDWNYCLCVPNKVRRFFLWSG